MNWETAKNLASSNFAKYTILIPIVGWLLVYNGTFQRILAEALDVHLSADAAVDWRILVFYLGLVTIGVSSALFQLRCPPEIKSHDGLGGFIDDTIAHLTEQRFELLCAAYEVKVPDANGPKDGGFDQGGFISREQWRNFQSTEIFNVLAARYSKQLTVRYCSMIATIGLFCVGTAVTLVPTVTTLWWVAVQIVS